MTKHRLRIPIATKPKRRSSPKMACDLAFRWIPTASEQEMQQFIQEVLETAAQFCREVMDRMETISGPS